MLPVFLTAQSCNLTPYTVLLYGAELLSMRHLCSDLMLASNIMEVVVAKSLYFLYFSLQTV
jgi:hypothetical protein